MPGGMGRMNPRGFLTDEEKANMPKVTKELLLRIFSYLKPYRWQFVLVFLTILISSVVGLLPSIITGRIVDQAFKGKDLVLLVKLLVAAFVTMTFSKVISVVESYINAWISQRIIFDMRNQMYEHLQHMPHSFFTTEKQGDIMTRMNSDISGVSSVISGTLTSLVSNIATVVTTAVALFSMSWQLALVGIAVIPLLILPTKSVGKSRWKLLTESQAKSDEMNQLVNETLSVSGSLLVKIFTREKQEYDRFVKVNEEVTQMSLKEQRSGRWFRVIMGMFTEIGPLLIYFFGGLFIIRRWDTALTVGTITATVALINRLYNPVQSLLNISVDFTRSLALFTRIFDYFDKESSIKNPENGLKPEIWNADICFEHVAFSYSPDKPLLNDIDFTVPGGKMYAIVGPSGSGKSTVVNLIPRLYDVCGGRLTIGGVDVREMDLEHLRDAIGVVSQETYLFNGTIRDNLLYAKEDATQEEIENACRIANIHDFVTRQPNGYNTEVGNRGLKLSGGEKQRLSLARVILKDPKILILDEATSALDSISENAIQDALEVMMQGRTSIVIAHRLSTILKADRILVVKDGAVTEQGTHEELLALGGTYRELYETQFRKVIEIEAAAPQSALPLEKFSSAYQVRRITEEDISSVLHLCVGNPQYYEYCPPMVTRESLLSDLNTLPKGKNAEDKYFVGYWNGDELIGVMDLVLQYPTPDTAYIGFFMMNASLQGKGIGTSLINELSSELKAEGFEFIRLAFAKGNSQSEAFWKKNQFYICGKDVPLDRYTAVPMERDI